MCKIVPEHSDRRADQEASLHGDETEDERENSIHQAIRLPAEIDGCEQDEGRRQQRISNEVTTEQLARGPKGPGRITGRLQHGFVAGSVMEVSDETLNARQITTTAGVAGPAARSQISKYPRRAAETCRYC